MRKITKPGLAPSAIQMRRLGAGPRSGGPPPIRPTTPAGKRSAPRIGLMKPGKPITPLAAPKIPAKPPLGKRVKRSPKR